jgi:hypothetical protein
LSREDCICCPLALDRHASLKVLIPPGQIGDDDRAARDQRHIQQLDSPAALPCYAGTAPVTRRSRQSDFSVARRSAHDRCLGVAAHRWAFCSLARSGRAGEFHDQKIGLRRSVLDDENLHVANRNRALGRAA